MNILIIIIMKDGTEFNMLNLKRYFEDWPHFNI